MAVSESQVTINYQINMIKWKSLGKYILYSFGSKWRMRIICVIYVLLIITAQVHSTSSIV